MTGRSTRWRRGAVSLLGALALLVATPAAALAHVRVDEGAAPGKGGYGTVRLSVPTESDTASTVELTVTVPADVRLTSARVLPLPGWTAVVETEAAGQRVTRIVWRADDAAGGIGPSEFGIFTFSAGPWPQDRDTVALPTAQRYSDGTAVDWDEVAVDADAEPEHPAPVVTLGEAAADHHGAAAAGHDAAGHPAGEGARGPELLQWALIGLAVVLSAWAAGASVLRQVSPARGK